MENNGKSAVLERSWLKTMASPAIIFYVMPWLMVLLVLGTVMQRELGLYEAQKQYFSAWILWLGPLPLPGGYTTLGVLTACLFAKFLLYSPWRAHQSGIILAHLGVLILLGGGMVTALTQKEGFLMLREGESGRAISDYHARVLRIEKDGEITHAIPFDELTDAALKKAGLPFGVKIEELCGNCRPVMHDKPEGRQGFAQKVDIVPVDADPNNEANLAGIAFDVSGADQGQDGLYISVEEIPVHPDIKADGHSYSLIMGRAQTVLPFDIILQDFKRELHPGTEMARGFSSDILVQDNGAEWPYHIRMNEPLRYKGYTFYQSSFSIRPDGEFTVLSVVENKGRIFPYIASVIIFAGLLLHLIIRLKEMRRRTV